MFRVGFVASPEYPNPYAANMDCTCNITTSRNQNLLVSFADFNLEWSENCKKDVVMVRGAFVCLLVFVVANLDVRVVFYREYYCLIFFKGQVA